MSDIKLNSFIVHPTLKSTHANKETKKLTNHDTSGPSMGSNPSSPTEGGSDTPNRPAPVAGGY